jgi:phenylacetate-CoA ligase
MPDGSQAPLLFLNPRLETMSQQELRELQLRKLKSVVERAYHTIPFYQRLYQKHGVVPDDIGSLDEFANKIPFISKRDLLHDQEEHPPFGSRQALGIPERSGLVDVQAVHLTSGTSGIGQEVHFLSGLDVESSTMGWAFHVRWAGLVPGDRVFVTSPLTMTAGGQLKSKEMAKLGLVGFFVASYSTEEKVALMRRFSPHALIAMPAYLTRITVVCQEMGIMPRRDFPDLKVLLTAAGNYSIPWAAETESYWGVRLSEWYGSTQSGMNQCFSCERGVYAEPDRRGILHNLSHRVHSEILDPQTGAAVLAGEEGEVVITNLFREQFPVIRFKIADRARYLPADYCDCGRPFDGIEAGTIARWDDMLKIKGQNVWPDAVDSVLLSRSEVDEYQGVVYVDNQGRETVLVALQFKPSRQPSPEELAAYLKQCGNELRQQTGIGMHVVPAPSEGLPHFEMKARRWKDQRALGRLREPPTAWWA